MKVYNLGQIKTKSNINHQKHTWRWREREWRWWRDRKRFAILHCKYKRVGRFESVKPVWVYT